MGDLFAGLDSHLRIEQGQPIRHYLTELLRHTEELKLNPAAWMPWNYRQNLTPAAAQAAPG